MTQARESVISLVEKGWAGARRVSIAQAQQGANVHHFVRGLLSSEVLHMVRAHKGITVWGISSRWYRLVVWGALVVSQFNQALLIWVDNERALRWVQWWFPLMRKKVILITEERDGSPSIWHQGQRIELSMTGSLDPT